MSDYQNFKKKFHKLYKAFNYPVQPAKVNSSETIMFGAGVVDFKPNKLTKQDIEKMAEMFLKDSEILNPKHKELSLSRFGRINSYTMFGERIDFGTS